MPNLLPTILVGSGMKFIRRRPDVFSAEQVVMQQIARYNISVADLYPRISLNGSIGFSAISFSNLGKERSLAWNLGPSISWAGLNFRRVRNQIAAEDAFTHSALHQYEQAVLTALEEIKTSMSFYTKSLERQKMLAFCRKMMITSN
ncbi:MAG: TolC family protein [Bacteroidota bacterium]